jgi:hypothetical protein
VKLICQLGFRSHIPLYDIGYSASIHHQPFWHLQGDRFGSVSPDMVDRFMYLEVIVAGQSWDSQLYHPSEIYQAYLGWLDSARHRARCRRVSG